MNQRGTRLDISTGFPALTLASDRGNPEDIVVWGIWGDAESFECRMQNAVPPRT